MRRLREGRMDVYRGAGLTLLGLASFALAASAEAQGEAQTGVEVVRLAEPLTVDGNLADWPGAAPLTVDSTLTADAADVTGDDDLSLEVWTAYDDAHFYLGADVSDDTTVFERWGDAIAETDALEFWLGTNQYGVALVEGQPVLHQWLFSGTESDLSGTRLAFRYTDAGYTVELSLPLAALTGATGADARAGAAFPFAVGADDADESGGERVGQLYYPGTWTWNETGTYATATLEE